MRGRSDGFTLIELLVTITIFGIVAVVGINVISLALSTYSDADQRVGESLDQQLTAVGFAGDVAGAITVDTAATACATGTVVAHFMSTDVTNTIDVYYTIPSPFVSPATLTRTKCINGTLSTSAAVATRLSAAPTMSCATSCSTSLTAVSLAVPESGGTFTLQGRRRL